MTPAVAVTVLLIATDNTRRGGSNRMQILKVIAEIMATGCIRVSTMKQSAWQLDGARGHPCLCFDRIVKATSSACGSPWSRGCFPLEDTPTTGTPGAFASQTPILKHTQLHRHCTDNIPTSKCRIQTNSNPQSTPHSDLSLTRLIMENVSRKETVTSGAKRLSSPIATRARHITNITPCTKNNICHASRQVYFVAFSWILPYWQQTMLYRETLLSVVVAIYAGLTWATTAYFFSPKVRPITAGNIPSCAKSWQVYTCTYALQIHKHTPRTCATQTHRLLSKHVQPELTCSMRGATNTYESADWILKREEKPTVLTSILHIVACIPLSPPKHKAPLCIL